MLAVAVLCGCGDEPRSPLSAGELTLDARSRDGYDVGPLLEAAGAFESCLPETVDDGSDETGCTVLASVASDGRVHGGNVARCGVPFLSARSCLQQRTNGLRVPPPETVPRGPVQIRLTWRRR